MSSRSIEDKIKAELIALCMDIGIPDPQVVLELPRQKGHGEFSCNVAMRSAKQAGMKPRELAEKLSAGFPISPDGVEAVEVAGPGFLNFKLSQGYFHKLLKEIVSDTLTFGDSEEHDRGKWLFEFVSANPTGPLNVVSARAASVGDTLVKVFRKQGYDARSEYYVNDCGNQIRLLGASVRARIENVEIPEGGYQGAYLIDLASEFSDDYTILDDEELGKKVAETVRHKWQEKLLSDFRVEFDLWFREGELYNNEKPDDAINKLTKYGSTYEKDNALFFKASEHGDNEDRVLRKSDGNFTYIVPDIAYHLNKQERGFVKAVTLLGPDHHGQSISMKAAMKALGLPDGFYHPIIVQQVNLKRDGKEIKMSKRAGVGIMMDELIDEVGVDAARFFFLMRNISSHLDFDMDVAKQHTDENPVYYVQYAHARVHQIFKMAESRGIEADADTNLSLLSTEEELDLLRTMARFPWTLEAIVRAIDPHPLTTYLIELARSFHYFYAKQRVVGDDVELSKARLALCQGVANILREGLKLMGVSAPEVM
ncbi:MAG: arginine--tRNA ligase [Calditrichaeota bacterium]|nr:arginine--tRNA ligase [Calditrichota bacterium]